MDNNQEALNNLDVALRLSPNNAEIYMIRFVVYMDMENLAEAATDFLELLRLLGKEETIPNNSKLVEYFRIFSDEYFDNIGIERDLFIRLLEILFPD